MENPVKMDDLGVPLFLETPMCLELRVRKVMWNAWITSSSTEIHSQTSDRRGQEQEEGASSHAQFGDLVDWFGDAEDMNMSTPPSIRV